MLTSAAAMGSQRTQQPIVTGGSVIALKYAGGILVGADNHAMYGSMTRFDGVCRMSKVGVAGDTLLAAGGDYSDYQEMLKTIEAKAIQEYAADDGATMTPKALHHWLTRILYNRRSKVDPLWNSIVVAGYRNGEPYLGTSDLYGTMFTDNFYCTGLGANMALPLLRKNWRPDLSEAEARKMVEDCLRVLFYRDTRASCKVTIGKVDASGASVPEPITLETYWEFPEFIKGGGHRGDGSW